MIPYSAPVDDMRFALRHLSGLDELATLPGYEEATPDIVDAVLDEAAKLAGDIIAPLNTVGDRQGSVLENGVVRTPEGFPQAYAAYRDGGWNAMPFTPEFGGQGLPWSVAMTVQEMLHAANMSFALCPTLNIGAVEAIEAHGTDELRQRYLPKLISGEWTGTMNLTEPQAGSDVGAVRTKAEPQSDGTYRIHGQKIYITYGEHDLADNVIHLVLARLPDAPPGTKGISLFLVPKLLPGEDGQPGRRNDVRCVSLEHKLGIHASPTCVMSYGDDDGAIGWLVGEENRGMACMFTMMNNARMAVGLQGVAIAERAYQQARDYARDRVQSRALGGGEPVAIIEHPDVRRMLMTMRSQIEAGRALIYYAFGAFDRSKRHPDAAVREQNRALVDLLTPMCKSWCTDMGVEAASLGVQVHGGMGFIEETGAAQHYRDARIAPIYEGTNGIQANDLVFRKVLRDDGQAMNAHLHTMRDLPDTLSGHENGDLAAIAKRLTAALEDLTGATEAVLARGDTPNEAAAIAVPYLNLAAIVTGGWLMGRSALAASEHDPDNAFNRTKVVTARFFADHILTMATGLAQTVAAGPEAVMRLDSAQL